MVGSLHNESLFQSIFQLTAEGVLVLDNNATILLANSACKNLFGYNTDDLLGKNIEVLILEKYRVQLRNQIKALENTTLSKALDLVGILNDGTEFRLEIRLNLAVTNDENLIIAFLREVSNRSENLLKIKQTNKHLLETNRKFDALLKIRDKVFASLNDGILISDAQLPNTPIIYCNAAFTKITGYKKEEIYGKNCNFLQSNDRNQSEIDIMKNAIAKGESCKVVLRNYKKDGTLFWNELAITPLRNHKNELTHFISIQNDVTRRIKEEDLKNKIRGVLGLIVFNNPLKTITRSIVDMVEAHIEGSLVSIQLLNKETKTLHELMAPHLPKTFNTFIEGITIGPKFGTCETVSAFLKKEVIVSKIEQHDLWEAYKTIALNNGLKSCWSFPILSSSNDILGVFAIYNKNKRNPSNNEKKIVLDATNLCSLVIEKSFHNKGLLEHKNQLEKYAEILENKVQEGTQEVVEVVQRLIKTNLILEDQLQKNEEARKKEIESRLLTTAIAKYFPKGFIIIVNEDIQLVLAEGEVLNQLGLKSFLFYGMTLDDISIFSDKRKAIIKKYISKTYSGAHLSFEIEYKNRQFALNTAPLFGENNQISYALLVFNDISSQKEIESKIKNALKKEKQLNELKSRFVSMASHEFRTPLSAIMTSAILIGKQNNQGKEAKTEKYLARIEKNVNHLVNILNDFLSLGKIEAGEISIIKEKFDIIYFAETIIKENKIGLKKGQHIHFKTTFSTLFVHLDIKLLRHIINNLLSNASKYSEEYTDINFKIIQNQNKVIIQISDQGMGIPEEDQVKLFHPFYRANNATNIEGTGLGLNIAKQYTELMDGFIGFKCTKHKGTTFWVELPIKE